MQLAYCNWFPSDCTSSCGGLKTSDTVSCARYRKMSLSTHATMKQTGQVSSVNCAKCSISLVPEVKMCKHCLQTASAFRDPDRLRGLRPCQDSVGRRLPSPTRPLAMFYCFFPWWLPSLVNKDDYNPQMKTPGVAAGQIINSITLIVTMLTALHDRHYSKRSWNASRVYHTRLQTDEIHQHYIHRREQILSQGYKQSGGHLHVRQLPSAQRHNTPTQTSSSGRFCHVVVNRIRAC